MNVVPLTVSTGRSTGSGPSSRLRVEDQLPAVVYGMGAPSVSVTVPRPDLRRALTTDAGDNALLELSYGDETHFALIKELQRDPVRGNVIHVDFQRIDPEKPIHLTVPIVLTGEAKAVAAEGGIVEQVRTEIEVLVRPDSIPNELPVDITDLVLDQVVAVADLILPAGVSTEVDPGEPIISATLTRAALVEEEPVEGEEGEEGEGEEGEGEESSGDDSSDESGD